MLSMGDEPRVRASPKLLHGPFEGSQPIPTVTRTKTIAGHEGDPAVAVLDQMENGLMDPVRIVDDDARSGPL